MKVNDEVVESFRVLHEVSDEVKSFRVLHEG